MNIRYSYAGKVVLVTGSSRGIGASILEGFAQAGAVCIINYFADAEGQNARDAASTAEKLKTLGAGAVHTLSADVSQYDSVASLMQQIQQQAGGLDILVNNAGILRDRTIRKMTSEDWQAVINTNLTGVFHCNKLGAEILRDGGRVVNISSVAGMIGIHGQANYSAAKAGVIAMTKVLAKELAKRKITVNAVAPGVVQTSMIAGIKPEMLAEYEKQIPVGRLGQPSDIANVVLFLAAEESSYITGQVIPVTGGWLV
ncbi:MAG TPA: 3-oxoacyl-ACP reductase FabG [Gemmatales bacterium]|nr:3-oxoacyl-ACP reductase FabG [Gemmatales bacterium]